MEIQYRSPFSRKIAISLFLVLLFGILPAEGFAAPAQISFTEIALHPNIETIGVVVSGADLPETAELFYRQAGQRDWQPGHPLMRIEDGQLVGSLFGLAPQTAYEVKVSSGAAEISASVTTQPDQLSFTPTRILYVDGDAAPDGDGSQAAPFQKIQDGVNQATPGTQVLVADGIYHETISFPSAGVDGNWIQVKAAGDNAILDGSQGIPTNWHVDQAGVWWNQLDNYFEYLARNGQRFFNYSSLRALREDKYGEGWYLEKDSLKLYVRTKEKPATYIWQMPTLNRGVDIHSQDWLWIEGFEIRFYGTHTNRSGIYAENASHLVIRHNNIHNVQLGIYIHWTGGETRGNDTRIEYNEISDPPVNEWRWDDVKGSSMEGTGIVLRGHMGAIIRGNNIHNFFNGIYTGSNAKSVLKNSELAFDADIYDNYIHQISDDALEPEGACVNHRFRENKIDSVFVGLSFAPITLGPTWVLRSTFANYTERGIKWASDSEGIVLVYHNTFWTTANDIAAMDFITQVRHATVRNNIFQNSGYAVYEVRDGSTDQDWDYNNWHTTHLPPFKWEDRNFADLAAFCAKTGLDCNSHAEAPALTNPQHGDFTLNASSPNIDRGVLIHGINDDFRGDAPDVGAYEYQAAGTRSPAVLSIQRVDPNPTAAGDIRFVITFSKPISGLDTSLPFSDLALTTSAGISGASILSVGAISETSYVVEVNTGAGSGEIRLDLLDDNSILNRAGIPLGGANLGDGNFNAGESYTVVKTPPTSTLTSTSTPISTLTLTPTSTPMIPTATAIAPVTEIPATVKLITQTFTSNGRNDGWTLESSESSEEGGAYNNKADTLVVGDDFQNRQYRSILHFPTQSLPNQIVIADAMLMLKKYDATGADLFATHQNILVDIQYGAFGFLGPFPYRGLQNADFQSPACQNAIGNIHNIPMGDWYWTFLSSTAFDCINRRGITQLRLRFQLGDNDDRTADYLRFYSGDAKEAGYRPRLIIRYYEIE